MSDWHTIDPNDPSTLPTDADADEKGCVWCSMRGGGSPRLINVEHFRELPYGSAANVIAWHPKPKLPPYTPPEPPKPKRREHCGWVAFLSGRGSRLAAYGSWAEVLPGDIDPDAAIKLRDVAANVIKMHDSGVLERQPHDSRCIDNLRAAVEGCRR